MRKHEIFFIHEKSFKVNEVLDSTKLIKIPQRRKAAIRNEAGAGTNN